MADSWRCKWCWKVLSGKHAHCPHCGGRWDKVQDTSYRPRERSTSQKNRGRQPPREVQWQGEEDEPDEQESRGRSGSAKKRRQRGKKKNTDDGMPHYAAPTMPPPWKNTDTSTKSAPSMAEAEDMTAEERAEMIQALRAAYPRQEDMPAYAKKIVDKYDIQTTQQLTKAMHRTTDSIKKARQMLHKLQDAKVRHRKSWLKHLGALMETLEKQVESFDNQQKDYQERIQNSKKELQISRRSLQKLNSQAAEAAIPEAVLEDEEPPVEPHQQDAEEAELRTKVNSLLRKCLKASAPRETVEIPSDEEEMEMAPTSKRPRSREPGFGGGSM
eukprot:s985_g3.t1